MIKGCVSVAALTLALSGCGDGGGGGASGPTPCALPSTSGDVDLLPPDLDLERRGVLASTRMVNGFASARIVTETPIVKVYPVIARSLLDNGYTILSGDNEGFEAEIFFERGKRAKGNIYMREGPCTDQVTLTVTYGAGARGGRGG